jgi:hypothetical protein
MVKELGTLEAGSWWVALSIHKHSKALDGNYVVEIANSTKYFIYGELVGTNEVAVARLNNQTGFTLTMALRIKYLEETISSLQQ